METTRGTHTILKRIRQSEKKFTFQCFFVFLPCDRCLGTWTKRQSFQCHGKLVSIMRTMALECNDCREQASNVDYIKAIFMWRTQWKKGSIFWASFGYVSIYFVNLIRAFTDFFHRKHLYGRMDLCNWYGTLDKHNNLMLAKLYNWNTCFWKSEKILTHSDEHLPHLAIAEHSFPYEVFSFEHKHTDTSLQFT